MSKENRKSIHTRGGQLRRLPMVSGEIPRQSEAVRGIHRALEFFRQCCEEECSETLLQHESVRAMIEIPFDDLLHAAALAEQQPLAMEGKIRGLVKRLMIQLRMLDTELSSLHDQASSGVTDAIASEAQRTLVIDPDKPIQRLLNQYATTFTELTTLLAVVHHRADSIRQTAKEVQRHIDSITSTQVTLTGLRRRWTTEFLADVTQAFANEPLVDQVKLRVLAGKIPAVQTMIAQAERGQEDIASKRQLVAIGRENMKIDLSEISEAEKGIKRCERLVRILRESFSIADIRPEAFVATGRLPSREVEEISRSVGELTQIPEPEELDLRLDMLRGAILRVETRLDSQMQDPALNDREKEIQRILICILATAESKRSKSLGRKPVLLVADAISLGLISADEHTLAIEILEHSERSYKQRPAYCEPKQWGGVRFTRLTDLGERTAKSWLPTTLTNEQVGRLRLSAREATQRPKPKRKE